MTHLPRKCVTWCTPHGDSFHQVWSWYDHPLHSYSVIAADTLHDLVTLTFDLFTLVSGHTWRVKWSTPPPSLKILRLSVLELWVLTSPIGYHWQETADHLSDEIKDRETLLRLVFSINPSNLRNVLEIVRSLISFCFTSFHFDVQLGKSSTSEVLWQMMLTC